MFMEIPDAMFPQDDSLTVDVTQAGLCLLGAVTCGEERIIALNQEGAEKLRDSLDAFIRGAA